MLKMVLYIIGVIFMASSGLNCIVGVVQGTGILFVAGVAQFFIGVLLLGIAISRKPAIKELPSNVCPNCGIGNNIGFCFCGKCGTQLRS